jgi:CHAD domain-containing protein
MDALLEDEVKFDAPIGLPLPDLRSLVTRTVRLPEEKLVTTYFDSIDRRLWQHGLTLRHRRPGGSNDVESQPDDGVWTLKLPERSDGPSLARTEVSWPGGNEVPDGARDALRGVIRREPLRSLVTLEMTRQRLSLRDRHDDEDQVVAELDDDLVLVVGGPRDGMRFRQVELELRNAKWKSKKVVRMLEHAGVRVEREPKLSKAIDLAPPSSPIRSLQAGSTMADVVQASLQWGVERLISHDLRLRLAAPQPTVEDVHQARVATRRLRSNLKSFTALLDPVWTAHVRSDLKWYGGALGEIRDTDVLAEHFVDAPPAVRKRLDHERLAGIRGLREVMASSRYLDLLDRLHAAAERLPLRTDAAEADRPAGDALSTLMARRWRAVRREVRRSGSHPSSAQLHRVRIKAKQLRYIAEAAVPIVGRPARRTAKAAERVQTVLGHHHDAVTEEDWLRTALVDDASFAGAPSVCFEAGRLVACAQRRQRAARRDWTRAWAKLRDRKPPRRSSH